MADRHVKPVDDGWSVEKENAQRPSARTPTQAEAITRAVEIIANDGGGNLVVYGTDGAVRERRAVESGTGDTDTAAAATKATASAAGTAARDTASKAADTAGSAARDVGSDTRTTGRKVAGETRSGAVNAADTAGKGADAVASEARKAAGAGKAAAGAAKATGEQLAGEASRTGRQVAGEVGASADRSASTVAAVADSGADSAVHAADRAGRVGGRVQDDLDDTGSTLARRVYEGGERAAVQLDRIAARVYRPLNPIRFSSRVAAGAVATAFGVTGAVTSGAGRLLQRGTRRATGR